MRTGLLIAVLCCACAEAVTDEADGDGGALTPVNNDASVSCDRETDVTQVRKDGPLGLAACRLRCTCAEGPANAMISTGDFCAAPAQACGYSCDVVERGAYVEGEYCYLGPPEEGE